MESGAGSAGSVMHDSNRRRVVITGIGCVTPLGVRVEDLWANLKIGASGVGWTTVFDASRFPTKISAEVRDWTIADEGEPIERWQHCGRHTRFAAGAALQAMRDAGLPNGLESDPTRMGVYLGSGEGQQDFDSFTKMMAMSIEGGTLDVAKFTRIGLETLHPLSEVEQEPNMPAGHLAAMFNANGPNLNCLTACAASSQAIGEAVELVRRGEADVMLSGGTHSMIHPFGVTGFNLLTALSTRNDEPTKASRPYDKGRDGFVMGEGAAMLILEERDAAIKRGANILAELVGYGTSADAYHLTQPAPEGEGAQRAMRLALKDGGIEASRVDYINAHGTSTPTGDINELKAIRAVFGDRAIGGGLWVSSTKSMTGHLLGASGALEAAISVLAIRDGIVPPTINLDDPDDEAKGFELVPHEARQRKVDVALSNSFGFGGTNVSLAIARHT